jgi:hypothetical protein
MKRRARGEDRLTINLKGNGRDHSQAQGALGLPPGSRGENAPDYDIKADPIKKEIGDLMKIYRRIVTGTDDFNAKAKAIAERGNCNATVLKRLVRVSYRGKFAATKRGAEHAVELYDLIGEVPGGKGAE